MCLGGHLAYRAAALDARVKAAVCYFATDLHSRTLGEGGCDDSLERAGDVRGELVMVTLFLLLFLICMSLPCTGVVISSKPPFALLCFVRSVSPPRKREERGTQRDSRRIKADQTATIQSNPDLRKAGQPRPARRPRPDPRQADRGRRDIQPVRSCLGAALVTSFFPSSSSSSSFFCWRQASLTEFENRFADAFIRDELSKGRYDPAIAGICFSMLLELFGRTLKSDLGRRSGGDVEVEDVC